VSKPLPPRSEQPQPSADESQPSADESEPAADESAASAPLNRAARRAKAAKTEPSHVGPRSDFGRPVRKARAHTKRRRG
jgi:hypothetical protein